MLPPDLTRNSTTTKGKQSRTQSSGELSAESFGDLSGESLASCVVSRLVSCLVSRLVSCLACHLVSRLVSCLAGELSGESSGESSGELSGESSGESSGELSGESSDDLSGDLSVELPDELSGYPGICCMYCSAVTTVGGIGRSLKEIMDTWKEAEAKEHSDEVVSVLLYKKTLSKLFQYHSLPISGCIYSCPSIEWVCPLPASALGVCSLPPPPRVGVSTFYSLKRVYPLHAPTLHGRVHFMPLPCMGGPIHTLP